MTTNDGGWKVLGGDLLCRNQHGALRKGARVAERETIRLRAFGLRARGFTGKSAECSRGQVASVLKRSYQLTTVSGFGPRALTEVGVFENDYLFVHPMNGKCSMWVRDRVTVRAVFHRFGHDVNSPLSVVPFPTGNGDPV